MKDVVSAFLALALGFAAARGDARPPETAAVRGGTEAPEAVNPWDGITQLFPAPPGAGTGQGHRPSPSLELVGEFALPDSAPEGLSGIAWRGAEGAAGRDDLYALVEDSGGRLHTAMIGIDRRTGAITNATPAPAGAIPEASDLEGVAAGLVPCPGAPGGTAPMFFTSDERGPAVRATPSVDADGPDWTALPLPEPLRRCRPNRALEALALSADGRTLWTANEGPLPEDGPEPTVRRGALVRLYGLPLSGLLPASADGAARPPSADAPWWFYPLDPATGSSFPHLPAPFNGLSELCALPDGRLLALERSFGFRTRGADDPRGSLITISIYLVDPLHEGAVVFHAEDAEDAEGVVSHAEDTEGAEAPVLAKTLLWRGLTGRANYEGMTLGPVLADGSRALILVADGDVTRKGRLSFAWRKALLSFRLVLP